MKINDMYPSKYVRGEDLGGKGWTVTIALVASEKMRPDPRSPEVEKFVLYTRESKRGIVLSKILALQIARALGMDDTDQWPGMRITIYPEPVNVAGVPRVAIRARAVTNGGGGAQ